MRYELFYLIGVSKELELAKIKQEVDEIIAEHSGVFEEKMTEEKRKMAYKIKKDTHGIYIAKRFSLKNTAHINEIIKKLNLHPGILRFIISDASALPELKTKEERIEQEEKRNASEIMQREKRDLIEKEKIAQKDRLVSAKKDSVKKKDAKEEMKESPEDKKEAAQDLDKKLEEILNI